MMDNYPNLKREKDTQIQARRSREWDQRAGGQGRKKHPEYQERGKRLRKNEERLREMQDNMKHNNIHIIGIPEGEEPQGIENLFEKVMMENFPNLIREKVTQIQETESSNQEEPKETHFKTHHN